MEEVLRLLLVLDQLGARSYTKAVGGSFTVDVARRDPHDASPAGAAVRSFVESGKTLTLAPDVLATVVLLPQSAVNLATIVTVACDCFHNVDQSAMAVRGGVIKGYTAAGACKTLGVLVTTSETAAMWAWAFSVLHQSSLDAGTGGCVATSLLHDCVASIFVGVACVIPTLLYHHWCSWHAIVAFEGHLAAVYSERKDLVEERLIQAVDAGSLQLSTALVSQRQACFHSLNAIILATNADDAAVLLEGFVLRYCSPNSKLRAVLSKNPYNDLSALLNCFCTTRAIDANCELFARLVRAYQRTRCAARSKMMNFGGALLLAVTALFDSARSEEEEARRLQRSRLLWAPIAAPNAAASGPFPAGQPRPPTSLPSLLAAPLHCASFTAASPAAFLALSAPSVRRAAQDTAACVPATGCGFLLRTLSFSTVSCSYTFSALMQQLLDFHSRMCPPSAGKAFEDARMKAYSCSVSSLTARVGFMVQACGIELQGSGDDGAVEGASSVAASTVAASAAAACAVPVPSAFAASPAAPPTDFRAQAAALFEARGFGGAGAIKRPRDDTDVRHLSVGKLPPLPSRMALGKHNGTAREQWGTCCSTAGGMPLTDVNKQGILRAHAALPSTVVIRCLSAADLLQRPSGSACSLPGDTASRLAPKYRNACAITLLCAAMRDLRGVRRAADLEA